MRTPLPAPAAERDVRVAGLRAWMAEVGAHAFVAVSPENVYYLTGLDHLGYFAFTALLVPASGAEPVVVTREMERPTVRAQLPGQRHVTFPDGADPAVVVDGTLAAPDGPGLGVALDADKVATYAELYRTEGPAFAFHDGDVLTRSPALPKR